MMDLGNGTDLIFFSSKSFGDPALRTSQLAREFAQQKRVYFIQSPINDVSSVPTYFMQRVQNNVSLIQPYLPGEISVFQQKDMLLQILGDLLEDEHISHYTMWTDTPRAVPYMRTLSPEVIIYDCVDNQSQKNSELEKELFEYADVVLTSGLGPEKATQRQVVTHCKEDSHEVFK